MSLGLFNTKVVNLGLGSFFTCLCTHTPNIQVFCAHVSFETPDVLLHTKINTKTSAAVVKAQLVSQHVIHKLLKL